MEKREILDKNIEEDIIDQLYLNNLYLSEKVPNTKEYIKITEKIKIAEESMAPMYVLR